MRMSVSLDLDNLWSYLKTHGDAGWESFPSYLGRLSQLVLERLERHGLTITFFVVGQDAALPQNQEALRALAAAGHELGNHSFSHEPWLHRYDAGQLRHEIVEAERLIRQVTGQQPVGFRGPGFSITADALRLLAGRGYRYDASTFPTYLGPVARLYYFWQSRGLSRAERARRSKLFGTLAEGRRPLSPYLWEAENGRTLVEIPVTTMPLLRVPIHLSYVLYLAGYSRGAALAYLRTAWAMCRGAGVEPSLLLHPLDFLGGDEVSQLGFFPGMDLSTRFKLKLFDAVAAQMLRRFEPLTLGRHAAELREARRLPRLPLHLLD